MADRGQGWGPDDGDPIEEQAAGMWQRVVAAALAVLALAGLVAGFWIALPVSEAVAETVLPQQTPMAIEAPPAPPIGVLPDPELTPGVADPEVTQDNIQQTICRAGYTATVRNVPASEKRAVLAAYRARHPDWPACLPGKCEYDHLWSLEIGGANDPGNLWPEPYEIPGAPGQGARDKDKVENRLHRLVCSGKLPLAAAQRMMARDWRTAAP